MSDHLCLTCETTNPDEFMAGNLRECAVCWESSNSEMPDDSPPIPNLRSIDEDAYLDDES